MDLPYVIKNKKIAILLNGHMRSFQQTSTKINELVIKLSTHNQCELFIHTWDEQEVFTSTYYDTSSLQQYQRPITPEIIRDHYYNPHFLIEKQDVKNPNDLIYNRHCREGVHYAIYSQWKANELKKSFEEDNNFKFDLVICLRPDVLLYDFSFPEWEDDSVIWFGYNEKNMAATDVVCFSSSENIDKLRSLYHARNNYIGKYGINVEGGVDMFMSDHNILSKRSKFTMPKHWMLTRSSPELNQILK